MHHPAAMGGGVQGSPRDSWESWEAAAQLPIPHKHKLGCFLENSIVKREKTM
eukprot:c13791_g2_i1 orf=163-318(-)